MSGQTPATKPQVRGASVARCMRAATSYRDEPLSAVINLVGGFAAGGRVHETPIEDFEAQLRLNLRPTDLVSQEAIPRLLASGGGRSSAFRAAPRRGAAATVDQRADGRLLRQAAVASGKRG